MPSIVEMSAAAVVSHVAQNCATGSTSMFDVDLLEIVGIKLSEDAFFTIANGLTTVEDVEPLWDAAFWSGVI